MLALHRSVYAFLPGKALATGITIVAIAATLSACATGESAKRAGDSKGTTPTSSSDQPANPPLRRALWMMHRSPSRSTALLPMEPG